MIQTFIQHIMQVDPSLWGVFDLPAVAGRTILLRVAWLFFPSSHTSSRHSSLHLYMH